MGFGEIRDQDPAVDALTRALTTGKVAHAYMFEGPPGVGKRLTARVLAMALNCEHDHDRNDACGACTSCRKITGDVHPDVRWLTLPEGKRRIPIEAVREAERWIGIRPHEGRAKVLIIEPADLMSEQAANALLKTLEEPRPGSFLIVITALSSSLLPTVRSRCQQVRFGPLSEETVAEILEQQGVATDDARLVAALGGGSLERSSGLLGEELADRIDAVLALAEGARSPLPIDGLAVAAGLRGDREEALAVLELLLIVLGEVQWIGAGDASDPGSHGLVRRLGSRLEQLARDCSAAWTATGIASVHKAITAIRRNNMNPQLAVEGVLMSMRGHGAGGARWGRIGERR
jgi:DNA polymerase-3 subunit delta'